MANEALKDQEKRFEPGQPVWGIERDEAGNARDTSVYLFMAQCGDVVILTSYINDYDWEDISKTSTHTENGS